ncbi:hypothetical protein ymoll0001_5720 [Yersinia mollaretii ATCC 43969]|uniref:Uncharacterized protein n=1 Tax=Yersinia mollaretii (strain ATCC 43969 / DSM 18520 / CIP 103324 / CNY 7263 / WAIP 204) TaxID=349967 RepID=A0ABM9Y9B6_YERMW|nr:hypothetical protein ymoll0001_5720 [Yersinia mollaretii ATCC 43969]
MAGEFFDVKRHIGGNFSLDFIPKFIGVVDLQQMQEEHKQ